MLNVTGGREPVAAMMGVMDYRIAVRSGEDLTDDDVLAANALSNAVMAELFPDRAPDAGSDALASHRATAARIRRRSARAWAPDGTLCGLAGFRIDPDHDTNPDLLRVNFFVHPDHRRRGIGAALLAELVTLARAEGRTRIHADTMERIPGGAAFAAAVGAQVKARAHINHLPVAEIDRALLETWVKEGPDRAPGYELIGWDGPVPDEHLAAFADIVMVMNSAPRDDLAVNDFTLTPELVREHEKMLFVGGLEMWTLIARHTRDGAFAGLHNVAFEPAEPQVAWVHMTGVQPEHRGHALGKWLKATMTLRILDERPDVADIRTGNADSNDAMLGINHAMGYRPMLATDTWELSVAAAEEYLRRR